jgi:hypothetical protein
VLVVVDDLPGRVDQQDAELLQPLSLGMAAAGPSGRTVGGPEPSFAPCAPSTSLEPSLQLGQCEPDLGKAVELVGAEHGSLRLLNSGTGELVLKSYWGGLDAWDRLHLSARQGITGQGPKQEPYLCHDAQRSQNVVLFEEMNRA